MSAPPPEPSASPDPAEAAGSGAPGATAAAGLSGAAAAAAERRRRRMIRLQATGVIAVMTVIAVSWVLVSHPWVEKGRHHQPGSTVSRVRTKALDLPGDPLRLA